MNKNFAKMSYSEIVRFIARSYVDEEKLERLIEHVHKNIIRYEECLDELYPEHMRDYKDDLEYFILFYKAYPECKKDD